MKDELELVFPSEEYKEKILDFKNEFIKNGENIIHGGGGLDKEDNFEVWLKNIKEDLTREIPKTEGKRVPASLYIAIRKSDKKIVGIIQIRHILNDFLLNFGGHIGDAIRPSERNKGYCTKMIGLALKKAKALGIGNVLMVCYKDNPASAKTIVKNGGVLENELPKDGIIYQRYWITLKKRYADGRNKSNDILEKEF